MISNARIVLPVRIVRGVVRRPGVAVGREVVEVHRAGDGALLLEELHAQALRHMPRHVAVEDPRARVVAQEGHHQPAPRRQHRRVAPRRVRPLQPGLVRRRVERPQRVARRERVGERGRRAEDEDVVALGKRLIHEPREYRDSGGD